MTIFFLFSEKKTRLDISCESSAWQKIHMKCQDLFSLKNINKNLECHLLQILLGALRVMFSVQQQIHFNGNVLMNKCFRCNKGSLYLSGHCSYVELWMQFDLGLCCSYMCWPIVVWRPLKGYLTNSADPDQNASSDQGLHCLQIV